MQSIDRRLASGWTPSGGDSPSSMSRADGVRSTAAFLDTPGGRIFAVLHEGPDAPRTAVVVCPPVYAEAVRNQRRELVLGWELSAAGIAAARFQYRGSGHSDGEPTDMTFDEMVHDAVTVADHVQTTTRAEILGFVGTRLGALVAAAASQQFADGPLVMWEPPIDLGRYYNEVFRARMIGLLKRGERSVSTKDLMETFATEGVMDVVGNPLAYSLYRSTIDLDVAQLILDAGSKRMLIVQMSVKPEIRQGLAALVDRCAEAGAHVEATAVSYDEAWWFGASGYSVVEVEAGGLDAIPITSRFLGEQT